MAFNTVQQIFDIIDDLINMMVDTNVTTIIATVTPTVAIFLTIKFMAQGAYSALSPGGGGGGAWGFNYTIYESGCCFEFCNGWRVISNRPCAFGFNPA
ncbi:hypothetical protein [Escherichia coli]|uniref:hypothetical protein n=1 Tax=Escherichia coli TaxID=562 RepID=UPI00388D3CF6